MTLQILPRNDLAHTMRSVLVSSKSGFSLLQRLETRHCSHLLLAAVLLRHGCCRAPDVQQSIDISCPPGSQQQTRCTCSGRQMEETDGRTDTVPLHRSCRILFEHSLLQTPLHGNSSSVHSRLPHQCNGITENIMPLPT